MSRNAVIAGAGLLALALFWKDIQAMLNGIVGGGGFDGQYFNPRDTSTSQGPAYDPPNPDAPITEETKTPSVVDTGDGIVDKQPAPTIWGESKAEEKPSEASIITEGMVNAAVVASVGYPLVKSLSKKVLTPKAYTAAKETATKIIKQAPKILKKAGVVAAVGGAIVLASSDKGKFGIGDALTNYVTNPLIKFGDNVLGLKPAPQAASNKGGSAPSTPYTPAANTSIKSSSASNASTVKKSSGGSSGAWSVSKGGSGMPTAGTKVYLSKGQNLSNFKKAGAK